MILAGVAGFLSVGIVIFLLMKYMNNTPEVVKHVVKKAAKKGVLHAERVGKISKSIAK